MKIRFIILAVFAFVMEANAQSTSNSTTINPQDTEGCYGEYFQVFSDRGAKEIPNGEHDVVISIVYRGKSECYFGKAKVENGKMVPPVQIQKDDLTFAPLSTIYRNLDQEWLSNQNPDTLYEIVDGMSRTFHSEDNQSGRVFFYTHINSKPKANRRAPSANTLIKN